MIRLLRVNRLRLIVAAMFVTEVQAAMAFSFNTDSIAKMGKFAGFCVKTYHKVDKFFNEMDTAYVQSTGYKMNVKFRTGSWSDINEFYFDGDHRLKLQSPYCSSIGFDVQYLAVALGYDINVNRLFGGTDRSKSRFNFEFSSALLSGRFYSVKNHDGMTVKRFGNHRDMVLDFSAMSTSSWGVDATYYFNHRRYSNSVAFSFGKIQKRSQGSFMITAAYQSQKMEFDFSRMPDEVKSWLPEQWKNSTYSSNGYNIGIGGGYGFNWVPCKNLTVGVLAQIIPSLNYGYLNGSNKGYSFRLNYRGGLSVVWNHDRWFIGASAKADAGFVYSKSSTLTNALVNFDAKVGWRFNLF